MSKKLSRAKRKELNLRRTRSGVSALSSSPDASPSVAASSKMTSTAPPPVSQKRRKVPRVRREEEHGEVVASEPVASTRAPKQGPKRAHVVAVMIALLGVCFAIVYLAKGGLPWGSSKKNEMVAPEELNAPGAKPQPSTTPSTKIEASPPAPVPPKVEPSAPPAVEAPSAVVAVPPAVETSAPKVEASAPPSAAQPTATATAAAPPKKPAVPSRQPAPSPPRAADPYE